MALELVEKIIAGDVDHEVCDWLRRGLASNERNNTMSTTNTTPTNPLLMELDHAERIATGHIDEAARAWLADAFRRWQAGDEPLETLLKIDRAARIRRRDEALRQAARLIDPNGTLAAGQRALRLASALRRHDRLSPGSLRGEIDEALARAKAAARCPASARHLLRIISE